MRSLKTLTLGVAMVLSLIGASSASAANWDPQNTAFTAQQEGLGRLTFPATGISYSCTTADATVTVPSASASIAMMNNPIAIGGCTDSFGASIPVTTFGTWNLVATDTTNVDINMTSGTGTAAVLHFVSFGCSVTIPSPINIPANMWNNTAHTLAVNSTAAIPVNPNTEACDTLFGTTLQLDANFVFPSSVVIT